MAFCPFHLDDSLPGAGKTFLYPPVFDEGDDTASMNNHFLFHINF